MTRVLLPFPLQRGVAEAMAPALGARIGRLDWHRFPDGESLVSIDDALDGADVAIVASLHHPDDLSIALRFAAMTAREFGAGSVGLVAPYHAYMRQDKRFHAGEAISSRLYAEFVQDSFDWLVTVDPHLHRHRELSALYRIPAVRVAAAPVVAAWIRDKVPDAVLIGPDDESIQWVAEIAKRAGLPWQVLHKQRLGDRDVDVSLPDLASARARTPVIVDDIIATGRTQLETLGHLKNLGLAPTVCVAIHAVFAEHAYEQLLEAGAAQVVSTDSIPHPSNAMSIAGLLADACAGRFEGTKPSRLGPASPPP